MEQYGRLEVTDAEGWRTEFLLQKHIVHIGSDPGSDVVLSQGRGMGVAPRHVQLIALPAVPQVYRVVNLGDTDVLLGAAGDRLLTPRSSTELADGEHIRLGDFKLVLRCGEGLAGFAPLPGELAAPRVVGAESSSQVIGLRLSLPQTYLAPGAPVEGAVLVRNLGDQRGVQFKLLVEGLDPDCYDVGAGPLLFPKAEKDVFLRLYHPQRSTPRAGEHSLSVRATAPDVYPGEFAAVSQTIRILPFYKHKLRLVTTEGKRGGRWQEKT
jgi:hypothetical protein